MNALTATAPQLAAMRYNHTPIGADTGNRKHFPLLAQQTPHFALRTMQITSDNRANPVAFERRA